MVSAACPIIASPFSKTISLLTLAAEKSIPSEKSVPAPPAAKTIPSVTASLASSLVRTRSASVTPVAIASSLFLSSSTLWSPPSVVASLVISSVKASNTADEAAVFQVKTVVSSAIERV